jgi:hypothetical protein
LCDMKDEFARLIREADDIKMSGRWRELNQKIYQLADNQNGHEAWQVQVLAALSAQNFSEYLALKKAYEEERSELSLLAWRARNLLEISVWSIYCAKAKENARIFYEDAGRDVLGVCKAFTQWGNATSQDSGWLEPIESAKLGISQRAASDGIESLEGSYKHVSKVADECGIGVHFKLAYKHLSKFAHPTAMLLMAAPDLEREKLQKDIFYSDGCMFYVGAFTALEGCLMVMVERPA